MYTMEKTTTRKVFGETVLELAREDENIIAIGGDSIDSMGLVPMQKEMPNRVFNVGICEQNAMASGAGAAAAGAKPVVAGFATFMTMRAVEQFRTFIAYPNLNVLVAGGMGGLSASIEGVTHQGVEDYGIMRHFPNTIIAAPADTASTAVIVRELMKVKGPKYIRLHKGPVYGVFDNTYKFEIGKANLLRDGKDVTIIGAGATVYRCLEAYDELKMQGVNARILEMPCIKPIDKDAIIAAAKETGAILTVEDHTVVGGLGSAVAETVCESYPVIVKRLGLQDVFAESGDHYALMDKYGFSVKDIVENAQSMVRNK